MRAVIQRVRRAAVSVEGRRVGAIGPGLLVLLGVHNSDSERDLEYILQKTLNVRIFEDEQEKLNRSLLDIQGELLVVSQFTLYGDCRKGRRPSFTQAAAPKPAQALYQLFCERARDQGVTTATGVFGAMMDVELVNDGPVTMLLESTKQF
ncbi:MAG: D-aminoacyl-tRNA deacylase [Candidatus Alcyoniella australis]|nr:D-aminoacyl-tRNA deacylase [Candidatus Alcyoniella australis]